MLSLSIASLHPSPAPCLLPRQPIYTFLIIPRLASRSPAASQFRAARMLPRSSISQVHNYGTVDYERNRPNTWKKLERQLTLTEDPSYDAATILEQWDREQKRLTKWELSRIIKDFRRFGRYHLALDIYKWIATKGERFTFNSSDAAIMLDLISKAKGISLAEDFFSGLSEEMKDKRTYGALLNAYAYTKNKHKAEDLFETMKNKGFTADPLMFNVMMTLYMKIGEHENVTAIVQEMKERGVKLDSYTYNIWISGIGAVGGVDEMEQVLELMNKDPGVNATWATYSTLANMYIRQGKVDKAVKYLKDAESRMTGKENKSFDFLISLYGRAGMKEEVYRVWKWYKSSFRFMLNSGYRYMLKALLKLGDIDGADKVFNDWVTSTSRYDARVCNILVSYYVKNGLLEEAESCLERFLDRGGPPNTHTWELLAEGNIDKKRTSNALYCLQEAASVETKGWTWRPSPAIVANYLAVCGEQNDQAGVVSLVDVLEKLKCLEDETYNSLISATQERFGIKSANTDT